MPETRYIRTFEGGVLINEETYQVSDDQLAEELASLREKELHDLLKQGANVIVSQPGSGKDRVHSIYVDPVSGTLKAKYNDIPV